MEGDKIIEQPVTKLHIDEKQDEKRSDEKS